MLRAAVQTIEALSPKLKFVTLITGTKVGDIHGAIAFSRLTSWLTKLHPGLWSDDV